MMKNAKRILVSMILGLSPIFPSLAQSESISISVGHQEVMSAPDVHRAAIGNAEVADVKALPSSQQVIVTGRSPGSTNLILWFKDGSKKSIDIRVSNPSRNIHSEVSSFLRGIEGIEIRTSGNRVIIDGQIFRGQDLDRVQRVKQLYPSVVILAKVNGEALAYIAMEVKGTLESAGIENITVRGAGDKLYIEGQVNSDLDKDRAENIAKSIFSNSESHLTVGVTKIPLILVDVKMMEVRTSSLNQFGLRWPQSITGTFQSSAVLKGAGSSSAGLTVEGATVSLEALVEKGNARLLSNPKLLVQSGTPAHFQAGGEIPIRLISERTASVEFKPYGVFLDVEATADQNQNVGMKINAKVSELDQATVLDGVPGLIHNQVQTAANLRFGDTIVLGGLFSNRTRKNITKVPVLGHIPIIGELFKSRAYQNQETEFLVFLTPVPANPGSHPQQKELVNMGESMKKAKNEVELSIWD